MKILTAPALLAALTLTLSLGFAAPASADNKLRAHDHDRAEHRHDRDGHRHRSHEHRHRKHHRAHHRHHHHDHRPHRHARHRKHHDSWLSISLRPPRHYARYYARGYGPLSCYPHPRRHGKLICE